MLIRSRFVFSKKKTFCWSNEALIFFKRIFIAQFQEKRKFGIRSDLKKVLTFEIEKKLT